MKLLYALAASGAAALDPIAGYYASADVPGAVSVASHSMIDLDMAEISTFAGAYDFASAKFVYENGGGGTDTASTSSGTANGNSVKGSGAIRTLKGFATSGEAKMTSWEMYPVYKAYWDDFNYADTFVQNVFSTVISAGSCYDSTTHLVTCDVDETTCTGGGGYYYAPGYVSGMSGCCHCTAGCDSSAETGTDCAAPMPDAMAAELIKKGIAYQADWMYVLHEFEDAIADCLAGDIYANDNTPTGDAPHAWDEGWAFYAGSLTGTAGGTYTPATDSTAAVWSLTNGKLLWELANKRCADYGTCNDGTSGIAKANQLALKHAEIGRDKIMAASCTDARADLDVITQQMTVPLIQGMLKYAFKADPANAQGSCTDGDCPKEWAEGWAFAAAVLPQINACDATVATMITENLDVALAAPMPAGFAAFKAAVEGTYSCLGVTCADIGAFQNAAGVYTGMDACTDAIAPIAGYTPATDVVPHSSIDLDMAEISTAAGAYDFASAKFIYENGGGGLCSAWDVAMSAPSDPCFGHSTADAEGNSVKGSGAIRTLKGFATSGEAKMTAWQLYPVYKAYWDDFNYADTFVQSAFTNMISAGSCYDSTTHLVSCDVDETTCTGGGGYYYAPGYVSGMSGCCHCTAGCDSAAETGTDCAAPMTNAMAAELVKKGIAYQADWMYVIHEFEDAIADCKAGDIYANDQTATGDAPHAWDEGWAFYAGSLTGTDGAANGKLLWELANKRCVDFGTCASGRSGTATANSQAQFYATLGRNKIQSGSCDAARTELDVITRQMTVPLVQGMLKYAFKADPANSQGSCTDGDCPKEWAEGWAFAAAVLPQLAACDADAAVTVATNLDVALAAPMPGGFAAVKTAVESTYACLGITCADVGAFQNDAGIYTGMDACEDAVEEAAADAAPATYLTGAVEVTGMTLAQAEANAGVFQAAVAASAGVAVAMVSVVFEEHDHRRRLAAHTAVECTYTIETTTAAAAAVTTQMTAVTPAQFEIVLVAAATAAGASSDFASVSVEAVEEPVEIAGTTSSAAALGVGFVGALVAALAL